MSNSKKYGLILPDKAKQQQPTFQASRNIFGNDSESEEEINKKPILLRPSDNVNRQAKVAQQKAIKEDPTVYQYDEVYDSMTNEKEEKYSKGKEERKPRYIENLLKTANKRKIENERRIERQIQKEREKEGDEFADKEVFVTTAYKKKLEELSLEEEREKREEYLESIGDVTKQKDLGGFYRHLYDQQLGSQKKIEDKEKSNVNEVIKSDIIDSSDISKKRNYRKRELSSELKKQLSEGEIEDSDDEINRISLQNILHVKRSKKNDNVDADSDFSIDDSSEDETSQVPADKVQIKEIQSDKANEKPVETQDIKNIQKDNKINETETLAVESKPKLDIWKKRTVGEVFQQALKRYYERKANRGT